MKKRRPCIWNQSRSPRTSSVVTHTRGLDFLPTRTKSSHDIKRRRLQRGKLQQNSTEHGKESRIERDIFGSLESLFDIKKPLNLSNVHLATFECHSEGYETQKLKFVKNSPKPPESPKNALLESNWKQEILNQEIDLKDKEGENQVQESQTKSNEVEAKSTVSSSQEDTLLNNLTEEKDQLEQETMAESVQSTTETEGDGQLPQHPVPRGAGEGASIKSGGNKESVLSASPLTDTAVMSELRVADERCTVVAKEIEQLKQEVAELIQKKDLTDEDTLMIQEKQENLMQKLSEFEKITRKLQRLLGLADPSSETFSKMFSMLPYPHSKVYDGAGEKSIRDVDSQGKITGDSKSFVRDDHFDMPQVEYPEDKLPRVIVCGYTEDEIPKIVVADGERVGKKKCLQNLTGKLTESLSMQEKLVKENAQLEGGKYRLEEALLEKDTAVECLQRKVCGLQAEMRIVVKENTELTRKLACLNQRVTSPTCCYTCPGRPPPPCSPTPSPLSCSQQDDSSCQCKCSHRASSFGQSSSTVCVKSTSQKSSTFCGSPRLAGGASKTGVCCASLSVTSLQGEDMCCRSPATGVCPADLETKYAMYGNNTRQLEQQLGSMECEVRNMQMELANVQRERQQLEQQRKLLKCSGPCAPCACCPPQPPCNLPQAGASNPVPSYAPSSLSTPLPPPPSAPPPSMPKMNQAQAAGMCTGPCLTAPMGASACPQQQLRDLREQYARLQDDYKNKLCEVSCLRTDTEKLKQEVRDSKEEKERMEIRLIDAQERLKALEIEREKFEGQKEQMVEQEQALMVAKQRFREAQDELEELRSLIQDQAAQLEDYRNKYLQAQQQVEEQRRQLDLMEMDNARMNENVTLEIGRVKNQFQEKLAELAPLPDILKQTQVKLQEAQQMRLVAERNCEDLSRELLSCKDKIQTLQSQLDVLRNEHQALQEERGYGSGKFDELEKKNAELRHENERMKNTLARFEEHENQLQKRIDEKMHEITQLTAMLEQVREDSARQVARTKERCETVRRSMQGQIAEMERQLAQCRATARAAQRDRDEIRQKMQGQINNLNEAFEQAQGRIRSLQGHVNYLKTSYSNIFKGQGESGGMIPGEGGPATGFDSCDCNY